MINFLKYRTLYLLISLIVIGSGIFSIVRYGYIYSIDFVGGTNIEYQTSRSVSREDIEQIMNKQGIEAAEINVQDRGIAARTKPIDEKQELALRQTLAKELKTEIKPLRFETVGATLGRETIRKTILASIVGVVGILLYMTFAFKGLNYAAAAIVALLHDLLVMVGVYSIVSYFFGAQLDTLFVTALLTTMSFSVHDTIVIFDKIREYVRYHGAEHIEEDANQALTETMVRSLNNSMTIVFMLLALILMGGSTIRFFVIALLIGTLTGTYSSPFIATPVLVWLEQRKRKR